MSAAEQNWRGDAACRDEDPALFFPPEREQYSHEPPWDPSPAKEVCGGCPVRDHCLTWALDHPEERGVWGGTTDRERRHLRRDRPERQQRSCVECGSPFEPDWHLTRLCSDACAQVRHVTKQREARIRRAS